MPFYSTGTETYLYLNGIKPRKNAALNEGITLMPSSCAPSGEDILGNCLNDVDLGIACIFLSTVSACLHVQADSPQELGKKIWGAAWDAILLSALYDCDIGFNFQCDVEPAKLSKAKDFHITNYAFRGLNLGLIRKLTIAEHNWISKYYSSTRLLMKEDRYQNAVHCLATYRWHSLPRAQLALIWSGIEGMFQIDYELSFRLSLFISKFLAPKNRQRRKVLFDDVKKLYNIRSKAVHGGNINQPSDSVKSSAQILRSLIVKTAERGMLPQNDDLYP